MRVIPPLTVQLLRSEKLAVVPTHKVIKRIQCLQQTPHHRMKTAREQGIHGFSVKPAQHGRCTTHACACAPMSVKRNIERAACKGTQWPASEDATSRSIAIGIPQKLGILQTLLHMLAKVLERLHNLTGRTLVDRLRPRIAVVNAGVEPTIALDRQPGCVHLGIPLQVNEVKEVPGRRPAAEVQRVQPERLVRDEYVMVIHDDALRCRPQPLRGRESEGGSQRGGRCAVALNANAPSHPTVATVNNLPPTLCFFLQLKRSCLRNRT